MTRAARKQESRDRIETAARRLFRRHGLNGVSVADIMQAAGLTHGAFYAHAPSKEALFLTLLESETLHGAVRQAMATAPTPAEGLIAAYLSPQHVEALGDGCALTAYGGEVARATPAVQAAFARAFSRITAEVAAATTLPDATARQLLVLLTGAVLLARALGPGGERDNVLSATARAARDLCQSII